MKKITLLVSLLALFQSVLAIEPFTITEIRVEGLERLDEGTVFNYLPLKVGDEVNDEETRISIKELFKTGFFKDVALEQDGTTLVVKVVERPSIASVTIKGNDKLKTELLKDGLELAGLVQGRIFNITNLDRAKTDIKNTYLSMGRYSATVDTDVEELDKNRVAVNLNINEGRVARIKKINITGAESVSVKKIKGEMLLKEKRGYRIFSRQDQYSKQKLEADLEIVRSYYLDRGYHEFEIVSSNVEISPNKQNIFISISVNEGEKFTFGTTVVEGVDEATLIELQNLVTIEPGKSFSRKVVNATRSALTNKFASDGYAFVEVRPIFDSDNSDNVVNTVFSIILNQRVYVRRIDISGNLFTRDEVIRRDLRQLEGAWYSAESVRLSKERLQRTGLFESVEIETPAVPSTSDQVDMKVVVRELDTGSVLFSAGFSDEDGVLFGAEFEQRNLLGTGKDLSIKISDSDAVDTAVVSYTNPFHTADGISRGFNFTTRKIDSEEIDTAEYILNTNAFGVFYKIPIAETNSIHLGLAYEDLELRSTPETPPEFSTVIDRQPDSENIVLTTGLSKDTRDQFFFPTRGSTRSISLEAAVPGSDFEYYKFSVKGTYFYPLSDNLTIKGSLGIGFGDGYGDSKVEGLPFFKNYFAGGARSIRGYDARSLGPVDTGVTPEPVGGDTRILTSVEVLFPAFGSGNTKDKRLGLFVDGGQVYGNTQSVELSDLRYSAGIFFNWFSAVGPFAISYGVPINDEAGDDKEELQVSIGTIFR